MRIVFPKLNAVSEFFYFPFSTVNVIRHFTPFVSPLDEIALKTNVSVLNEDPEAISVIQPLYEASTQEQ